MVELKGKYSKDCKIFVDDIESGVYSLVQNILNEKVSDGVMVRIMPDTHVGKDIVIGFTMPLTNMVNPAHIGVDIGCGIITAEIKNINNTSLSEIDKKIRKSLPMGFGVHKKNVILILIIKN